MDSVEDSLVPFDLEKSDLLYQVKEENRGGSACRGRLSLSAKEMASQLEEICVWWSPPHQPYDI